MTGCHPLATLGALPWQHAAHFVLVLIALALFALPFALVLLSPLLMALV